MLKNSFLALFVSSMSLVACGGGDGGGGSGLDSSKDLLSLTDAEIIQFCEYSESLVSDADIGKYSCYVQGIYGAQEGGDCQMIYEACLAEFVPEPSECATAADEPLPACASMITVAELESCLSASSAQFNVIRSVNCSTTPAELEELSEQPEPAECASLEEQCPGFFE